MPAPVALVQGVAEVLDERPRIVDQSGNRRQIRGLGDREDVPEICEDELVCRRSQTESLENLIAASAAVGERTSVPCLDGQSQTKSAAPSPDTAAKGDFVIV
jgi:hypothetical protein